MKGITATKIRMGFMDRHIPNTCSNCAHFRFDNVQTYPPSEWNPAGIYQEKNLRCEIGGFKVKKTSICNEWAGK